MNEERMPMPPATFEFLVYSLRTQAEMSMGLYQFEDTEEEPEPDFEVAQHSIDMLSMIAEKTRGNLSTEEELLLHNTLAELRFRFGQAAPEVETPRIIIP